MITCGEHGELVDGYAVCLHVLAGQSVAHRLEPDPDDGDEALGEVLCAACAARDDLKPEDVRLICGGCVERILGPERPQ